MHPSTELEELLAAPRAKGGMAQFIEGAHAPWRGYQFLNRNPGLWRYAILPVVLNIIITGLVLAGLVWFMVWFASYAHPRITGGRTGGWWWTALAVEIVLGLMLLVVCGGAALLFWKLLSGVLCGYFYARLAEKVERRLGIGDDEIRSITLWHEVVDTVLVLSVLTVTNIFFLLLNVVPFVGGAIGMIGSSYVNWFVLGFDYLNFPLALRGMRRGEQFKFCRRRQAHTLGIGAMIFLFEFLPIVGGVFLTTAVVGAVLLHRRIETVEEPKPIDAGLGKDVFTVAATKEN